MIVSAFSDIKNRNDFFRLLNIPKQNMTYLLYNKVKKGTENSYQTFEIKKRSGGVRIIHAPNDELKFVQQRLANLLWMTQKKVWRENNIKPNISHAFEKEKSIITNAKIHRNKRFVLNVDLEDFFNSFHFGRVKGFFEKDNNFEVPKEVALIIAQLTCYQGVLPQGAPSSPIITNLICKIMDFRILKLAKKYRLDYSRYADDLTFSTNNSLFFYQETIFLKKLNEEIERAGFKINTKKTRLQFSSSRQEVTGLIVNKKINVPREYYRNTRAMAYSLYKNGEFTINDVSGNINQLEGRFAFINQLDKWNNKLEYNSSLDGNHIEYQKYLLSTRRKEKNHHTMLQMLNSREREYQKFLYYKYFYGNELPTIFTEGKTDIRYLKAALKNLYKDYPNLVEKKNNKFVFKVFFFKKSKQKNGKDISRYKYFFNLPIDGADSMKNLYNFFSEKNNKLYPNYLKYFNSFGSKPTNPTFFIFDNEILSKKEKPVKSFINYVYSKEKPKIKEEKLKLLGDNLSLKIAQNLFLVTNKLLDDSEETEIEDLFDDEILAHEISGKTFSKVGESSKHYGKEIFSKFILKNYEEINFDNFRSILDNLNKIILDYNKSD
ncbi:retron Ec67 family RNA-directed DNA polymerase/endonuclease [Enterococcus avium]|uniref:retron Ec67 family RNA-directed DNA polymerase/endonuclease n=1 Tax=Enterococcus avium TaxID=33945 RepID=UPI00288F11B6|nr:retron Ec67 family RNA-directed DNA polymerase/endonuclease [Enterococcus avium]MDT2386950.1 retron Ec67 family RNA-directed DNA polymerase/endonuclease [Enterococcus avium]MDT2447016.1 retron Ec67 family RNA-directed DNA polymerase/endonuclease [Enterococcus avium]